MKKPLDMLPWEAELFERTKEFVAKVCPKVTDDQRYHVVASIYDQMRRTLIIVGHQ